MEGHSGQMSPDFGTCIYCIQRTLDTSFLSAFLVTGSIRNGVRKGKRMRSLGDFCPVLVLRIKGRYQAVLATGVRRFGEGGLPLFTSQLWITTGTHKFWQNVEILEL